MSAGLHLLHLRIGGGDAHFTVTCEDPTHAICKTQTENDDELIDECYIVDWFDDCGIELLVGDLNEPTFPVAVTPHWDGDSAALLLPGAVRS